MNLSWKEKVESHPIHSGQSFAEYLENLPSQKKSFESANGCVGCMDGGVGAGAPKNPKCGIRVAGSGMAFEGAEEDQYIDWLHEQGARVLTSHPECGAAGLYATSVLTKQLIAGGDSPDEARRKAVKMAPGVADSWGRKRIQAIAQRAGLEYQHIDELARPMDFHPEWAAYLVEGTDFYPLNDEHLPFGFVISYLPNSRQSVAEVMLAAQIAFGPHGWGERFSSRTPFLVVPMGLSAESTKRMSDELQPVKEKFRDLLRVDAIDLSRLKDISRV